MLRSIKELMGCHLMGDDEKIGKCRDFLFDDQRWVIRYLVADTGGWLSGRKVVVSPYLVADSNPDPDASDIRLKLNKDQIAKCPPLEEHEPISKQYEIELARYYGHPSVKNSPPYDPMEPINRDYEGRLHDYYGSPCSW